MAWSAPALKRGKWLVEQARDYAAIQFHHSRDGTARGAVPVERRTHDEVLSPDPIDVAAVLDEAVDSFDPAATIEALAPTTQTHQARCARP